MSSRLYNLLVISDENAATLKDWADSISAGIVGRNAAIKQLLGDGATVAEIVTITGLSRARIYQIKDEGTK